MCSVVTVADDDDDGDDDKDGDHRYLCPEPLSEPL